ncbi:MAG: hypothetical protein ACRYGG_03145 [Janthinobacterium lividum]
MPHLTTEEAVEAALERRGPAAPTCRIHPGIVDEERERRGVVGRMPDGKYILANPGLGLHSPSRRSGRPQSLEFQRIVSRRAYDIYRWTGSTDHVRNWYQAEADVLNIWMPRKRQGD